MMNILVITSLFLWYLLSKTAFIGCGHMYETQRRVNWTDAFRNCQLATKSDAYGYVKRYRAWVGALQLNTHWMVHEGCFYFTKTIQKHQYIIDNSPGQCSYHCRNYTYFVLKLDQCMCDHNIFGTSKVNSIVCDFKCIGSKRDRCGSNSQNYGNVYRHVTGRNAPIGNNDAEYSCSVFRLINNTVNLYTTNCFKKKTLLCDFHKSAFGTRDYKYGTFPSTEGCNLRTELGMDTIHKLQLRDGEYWTGIHRRQIIKWLETESFSNMCDVIDSFDNIRCIAIDWKSRNSILVVPMPCEDWLPVLCSKQRTNTPYYSNLFQECTEKNAETTLPEFLYTTNETSSPVDPSTGTKEKWSLKTTVHGVDTTEQTEITVGIQISTQSWSSSTVAQSDLTKQSSWILESSTKENSSVPLINRNSEWSKNTTLSFIMENATQDTNPDLIDENDNSKYLTIIGITLLVVCIIVGVLGFLFLYYRKKKLGHLKSLHQKDTSRERPVESTYTIASEYVEPKTVEDYYYADPVELLEEKSSTEQDTNYAKDVARCNMELAKTTLKLNPGYSEKELAYAQSQIDSSKYVYDFPKTADTIYTVGKMPKP